MLTNSLLLINSLNFPKIQVLGCAFFLQEKTFKKFSIKKYIKVIIHCLVYWETMDTINPHKVIFSVDSLLWSKKKSKITSLIYHTMIEVSWERELFLKIFLWGTFFWWKFKSKKWVYAIIYWNVNSEMHWIFHFTILQVEFDSNQLFKSFHIFNL